MIRERKVSIIRRNQKAHNKEGYSEKIIESGATAEKNRHISVINLRRKHISKSHQPRKSAKKKWRKKRKSKKAGIEIQQWQLREINDSQRKKMKRRRAKNEEIWLRNRRRAHLREEEKWKSRRENHQAKSKALINREKSKSHIENVYGYHNRYRRKAEVAPHISPPPHRKWPTASINSRNHVMFTAAMKYEMKKISTWKIDFTTKWREKNNHTSIHHLTAWKSGEKSAKQMWRASNRRKIVTIGTPLDTSIEKNNLAVHLQIIGHQASICIVETTSTTNRRK